MAVRTKKLKEPVPTPQVVAGPLHPETTVYKENGRVDWRKMIPNKYVVVNNMVAAHKGIDLSTLDEEQLQRLVDESPEEDLVIKLAGFREVAALRGYSEIDSQLVAYSDNNATIKVTITWVPNSENPNGLKVSAIANASSFNTDEKFAKFLETIAENRAFIRAVRHSLNIIAVGQDEFKQEDVKTEVRNTKIQTLLSDLMAKSEVTLDNLKEIVGNEGFEWNEKWVSVEKIDPAAVMSFIPILKKLNS
jgi:hypothetical protein